MPYHLRRPLLSVLLILFLISFVVIGWFALREGVSPVSHFFDLLQHDRVMQLVMLDFTFFFIWVFLWMIDRARQTNRTAAPWIIVGILAASLMIYLFILTEKNRNPASSLCGPDQPS